MQDPYQQHPIHDLIAAKEAEIQQARATQAELIHHIEGVCLERKIDAAEEALFDELVKD